MHISIICRTFAARNGNAIMSPTFKREKGYTFKIYSNEEERMHIHVVKGDAEAKFWLEPQLELASNDGYPKHEINTIQRIIENYADHFKQQYQQHISKRIDD